MLWLAHELRPPSDYQSTYAAPSLHKKDSSVSCAESALKFSGLLPPTYREYRNVTRFILLKLLKYPTFPFLNLKLTQFDF